MEVICSVCQETDADKVVPSTVLPGARFAACQDCLAWGAEPRPLVILGYVYGNSKAAWEIIKEGRYSGEDIKAKEIIN